MRKKQKNQLIELINTVEKTIKMCKKTFDIEMLADCQNAVAVIGEVIEQNVGMDTLAVKYLEEFSDIIYNGSVVIDDEIKFKDLLNKSIKKLEQSAYEIKKKLPTTYEILFLPYKASMWDSFDSVYNAAVKSNDCHITVMPIPYYSLGTSQEVVGVEYEGFNFPENINITSYNEYSIAENKPDAIFIHNPYDNFNYVTQVPEQFFSSELIKYTDRLVYIPYFANNGREISEHYCCLPGVENSWRTFVHSKKVKEIYDKFNSNEKIVAVGSPKFDMVIKYEKDKPEIPKEWEKVFEGKKVILYNTHLRNIIGYAEELIEKLEYVFSVFKNRNDAAILWRPHPLSLQTAKAMNPSIYNRYTTLIEKFKTLPNGVYDDTADIHRAIAVSDAYLGDSSSVVAMFAVTGKPIYIMKNPEIYTDDCYKYILCHPGVSIDNRHYVFSADYNALFSVIDKKAEYVCSFDVNRYMARDLFSRIEKYKDELILIPDFAEKIVRYNIKTNEIKMNKLKMDIPLAVHKNIYPLIYGSTMYMFIFTGEIWKMNLETGNINFICKIFDYDDLLKPMICHIMEYDDKIYIPCMQKNSIAIYDIKTETFEIREIAGVDIGFRSIAFCDEKVYILSAEKRDLFEIDMDTMNIKLILQNTKSNCIHGYKDRLFLIPDTGEYIKILFNDGRLIDIDYPKEFRYLDTYKRSYCKYFSYKIRENILELYPRNSNMYLEIDMDTLDVSGEVWQQQESVHKSIFERKAYLDVNGLWLDGRGDLNSFIDYIDVDDYKEERKKYICNNIMNLDGSAGTKIWDYVYKNL